MPKQIPLDLDEEDFVIKVHPHRDKNNKWTGDVTIGIITSKENPLTDDDFFYMMEFTNLICATVPMMNEDPSLRDRIEAYVQEERKREEYNNRKVKPRVTSKIGNVINISFNDKTDGSA
tara:strand:- start:47 stop:403 length:357 start_codon:yes stop_codon:yes gene_type:complete